MSNDPPTITGLIGASTTVLARTSSVNGLTKGNTLVYLPTGGNYVADKVRIGLLTFERMVIMPTITIGNNVPEYNNILGPILLNSLVNVGDTLNIPISAMYLTKASPSGIFISVSNTARGISYNFIVQLIGHYL